MILARVFPRRTRATPDDALAFTGPPDMFPVDADAIHISVTFTYDLPRAERLARAWESVGPVSIGGPGTGMRGEDFVPGRYLKEGYTITSRGCPNKCWFCSAWKRDGVTRELPIADGWDVLDDNLLACSESHIRAVFAMLKRQPKRARFTGGLEAARLRDWHVALLADLHPATLFLAYDTLDDEEPVVLAARKLVAAGICKGHQLRCYVLCGYPRDTMTLAETRLRRCVSIGLTPMAMLWKNEAGETDGEWRKFQRSWARPAIMYAS